MTSGGNGEQERDKWTDQPVIIPKERDSWSVPVVTFRQGRWIIEVLFAAADIQAGRRREWHRMAMSNEELRMQN